MKPVAIGMAKGNNANALPPAPTFPPAAPFALPPTRVPVSGDLTLREPLTLGGLFPDNLRSGHSTTMTAVLPDGTVLPLVWLYEYQSRYAHPFFYRTPIRLPAGATIRGVDRQSRVWLLPATTGDAP